MGLALSHGGHLTHGHQVGEKAISASSRYFESQEYFVDENGLINYDDLADRVAEFKPKLLIAGASAYPADYDYERLRAIADSVGAYLMVDMAHTSIKWLYSSNNQTPLSSGAPHS